MKIKVICIGKTQQTELKSLLSDYCNRLSLYTSFYWHEISDLKNTKNITKNQQKTKEAKLILACVGTSDTLFLFDEKGSTYTSKDFAQFLQKKMNTATKKLVLVIGGPYGFSQEVYNRAQGKIALSEMTFSHQMVRIFVAEQLYRAFSIINNHPYHHE